MRYRRARGSVALQAWLRNDKHEVCGVHTWQMSDKTTICMNVGSGEATCSGVGTYPASCYRRRPEVAN
jgi:hypothetical protein